MLNFLYQILIAIGVTIALVVTYLWWQARSASQLNLALIKLNEQHHFDVPSLLQNAWPLLKQSGLSGFVWDLNWYGATIQGEHGQRSGKSIPKKIDIAEMHLSLVFYQNQRGEKRYFDESLIETFLLLLNTDMWIKAGAVDATMSQMAKLTLFLEHDMKNIAQFIQLMADQLETVPPEKEQQMLQYLKKSAPLIRQRADHIVKTLTVRQALDESKNTVQLQQVFHRLCHLYQLDYELSGDAQVVVLEKTFENAMENVLKNYHDMYLRDCGDKPRVSIQITQNGPYIQIKVTSNKVVSDSDVGRFFEPFWSSSADGLGIGLYQARHMLEKCDAAISAFQNSNGQLVFTISLQANLPY